MPVEEKWARPLSFIQTIPASVDSPPFDTDQFLSVCHMASRDDALVPDDGASLVVLGGVGRVAG